MKTADLFPQHLIRQGLSDSHQVNTLMSGPVFLPLPADFKVSASSGGSCDRHSLPLSRRNDPPTSLQAAQSMVKGASAHRVQILIALALYGPQTIYELGARVSLSHVQVARRTAELHEAKTIERIQTGVYHNKPLYQTRKTPSGRQACVWRVVK